MISFSLVSIHTFGPPRRRLKYSPELYCICGDCMSEFERIKEVEAIVSKSKLTEEQAKELADEVSMALSKRFLKK